MNVTTAGSLQSTQSLKPEALWDSCGGVGHVSAVLGWQWCSGGQAGQRDGDIQTDRQTDVRAAGLQSALRPCDFLSRCLPGINGSPSLS